MKVFIRNTVLLISLIGLDQVLKYFFETTHLFVELKVLRLHLVKNTGASFGMLQGNNMLLAWISIIVLGLIMLNIDKIQKEYTLPIILLVAGLLSNLIDRLFRGFVIDFIDFKFWPVFNLADSLMVIGVAWLIIIILRKDFKNLKEKEREEIKKKRIRTE
ncbi:MAG TPA: signal peptidase II [Candidatus Woesearchaeota archaeon]|nr:signal peptidase II [Candidatus Woesearchaeota archaeon]